MCFRTEISCIPLGLCNNYLEGGGKLEGGIGENDNKREGDWM